MSVKDFFKRMDTREDIGDRDEDYGTPYVEDEYEDSDRGYGRAGRRNAPEYREPTRKTARYASDDEGEGRYANSNRTYSRDEYHDDRPEEDRESEGAYGEIDNDRTATYYEPQRGYQTGYRSRGDRLNRRNDMRRQEPDIKCYLPTDISACREEIVRTLQDGDTAAVDIRKLDPASILRLSDFLYGVSLALRADMGLLDDSSVLVLHTTPVDSDTIRTAVAAYEADLEEVAADVEASFDPVADVE